MYDTSADEHRSRALWSGIAIFCPVLGFIAGLAGFVAHVQWGLGPLMDPFEWGFRIWFGFSILGIGADGIALLRQERFWGLTGAGIVLNLGVLALIWSVIRG